MIPKEKAKLLYDELEEKSKGCGDVSVNLNDTSVSYEDQRGYLCIDFENLILKQIGDIEDTFCSNDIVDFSQNYITNNTTNVKFEKVSGRIKVNITNQFKTLRDLEEEVVCITLFDDIDCFKKLFEE